MQDDKTLQSLRERALSGDDDALAVLNDALREMGPLTNRYLDGDCAGVWADLVALGGAVRARENLPQAWGIAWETMRRARHNLQTLVARYRQVGYELGSAQPIGTPAGPAVAELESRVGPIPLSMRAFWTVVGSVDLTQSADQRRHGWLEDAVAPLEGLGDDDPLFVDAPAKILAEFDRLAAGEQSWLVAVHQGRYYVQFAPDCFHKNDVSGGENYHLWLPEPAADFRILGDVAPAAEWSDEGGQHFVSALRRSFVGGGFRGAVDFAADDPDEGRWLPWKPLHQQLGAGLLPI